MNEPKPYFVYVLWSKNRNSFSIGITENLEKRLNNHNSGVSKWTKGKGPWKLDGVVENAIRESPRLTKSSTNGNCSPNEFLEKWTGAFLDKQDHTENSDPRLSYLTKKHLS